MIPIRRTDEVERYLIYSYLAQLKRPSGANAPFLVGPPGVGKSYVTASALVRLTNILATIYFDVLRSEGKDPKKVLPKLIKEAMPSGFRQKNEIDAIISVKLIQIFNEAEKIKKKEGNYYSELYEDMEAIKTMAVKDEMIQDLIASVPTIIARAVLAEYHYPGSTKGMVIKFDSKIPLWIYKGGAVYVSLNMGTVRPETLVGIPLFEKDHMKYLPPDWAVALGTAKIGVLNLDEFANEVPETILSASYELVLNKRAGNYTFGKPVTATGNTKKSSSLVIDLPGPLFSGRLEQILVEPPTVDSWIEFMNRNYGNNWPIVLGTLLNMFSKYGSMYREIIEAFERMGDESILMLFNEIRKKISQPFSDPFYPDVREVAERSRIPPGDPNLGNYPSPRAWEHVSVEIWEYLKGTTPATKQMVAENIRTALASLGMPIFANLADVIVDSFLKGSEEFLIPEDFLNIKPLADAIEKFFNEIRSGEDVSKPLSELVSVLTLKILQANALVAKIARASLKEQREIAKKIEQFYNELEAARMRGNINERIAAIIINSLIRLLPKMSETMSILAFSECEEGTKCEHIA